MSTESKAPCRVNHKKSNSCQVMQTAGLNRYIYTSIYLYQFPATYIYIYIYKKVHAYLPLHAFLRFRSNSPWNGKVSNKTGFLLALHLVRSVSLSSSAYRRGAGRENIIISIVIYEA